MAEAADVKKTEEAVIMKKLSDLPWLKKGVKIIGAILLLYFATVGFYQQYITWQYNSLKNFVEGMEAERSYDGDFGYLLPLGEPIFLINPEYSRTLFFIEGFRGQVGAGIYRDWFEELHQKHDINVVAPIIGMQGWKFEQRMRPWTHQEDMRQIMQIYDAYTANLPEDHRIVIGSQSFGTLASVTINAKAGREPWASVFCAPLNTGLEYKSGGPVIRWLATQTSWLQYIVPYMKRNQSPDRAGLWDIINDEKNEEVWENIAKDIINWEEVLGSSLQVQEVASYMENDLIPRVTGKQIYICYGDDDLYFSQAGFENIGEIFSRAGNEVTIMKLDNTGHMLLFDNGGQAVKDLMLNLLTE